MILTVEIEWTVLGGPRRPLIATIRRWVVQRVSVQVTKGEKVFDLAWYNTERNGGCDEHQDR